MSLIFQNSLIPLLLPDGNIANYLSLFTALCMGFELEKDLSAIDLSL